MAKGRFCQSSISGRILSVLDRAFYAGKKAFEFKPGASIISARRGGTVASFDVLNKYFTISQMPIVSSTYWNNVHGNNKEVAQKLGELIAKKALEAGITQVVFDRSGYLYHGRVKELAEAARKAGLDF